ncbi:MAG: hypothetical protein EP302_02330 [Bacteroidetes bacterium]|jgi:hypothetical protein|nr:MAG: hypothetical protein EP302_02330 [Bacteroidota bacterium]
MEKQYCKVGTSHPLGSEARGLDLLENLLSHFNRKAAEAAQSGSALKEFFERKAQKIQKVLQ